MQTRNGFMRGTSHSWSETIRTDGWCVKSHETHVSMHVERRWLEGLEKVTIVLGGNL